MKTKFRKFDSYIDSWYGGFNVGYLPIRTWDAKRLINSQVNEKHSDKMKHLVEVRRNSKCLHDAHHRIFQRDQRALRRAKKMWG